MNVDYRWCVDVNIFVEYEYGYCSMRGRTPDGVWDDRNQESSGSVCTRVVYAVSVTGSIRADSHLICHDSPSI